jgi:hypothetical protein
MKRLRFFIVLLLCAALDFAAPVGPEALGALEEFEEAAHSLRTRRSVVLARDVRTPASARDAQRAAVRRPVRVGIEASRRRVTVVPARNAPLADAESPSAPEDH